MERKEYTGRLLSRCSSFRNLPKTNVSPFLSVTPLFDLVAEESTLTHLVHFHDVPVSPSNNQVVVHRRGLYPCG